MIGLESPHAMLPPVLALVLWTFVMLTWLYATRLPAMAAAQMKPTPDAAFETLPGWARRPAANYNHLHEQPTLFYALAIYCHLAGAADPVNAGLAWAYVGLRVIHSLVQSLTTFIPLRFALFMIGSICLAALAARAALDLLAHA